jgi:hypothetical protein
LLAIEAQKIRMRDHDGQHYFLPLRSTRCRRVRGLRL